MRKENNLWRKAKFIRDTFQEQKSSLVRVESGRRSGEGSTGDMLHVAGLN